MLVELKACFMEAYDDNQDGKIDIREASNDPTICSVHGYLSKNNYLQIIIYNSICAGLFYFEAAAHVLRSGLQKRLG